ncbi:MAG: hypothetical protein GY835_18545 [bacterium]|nr:hypothetical protein [bacterium]
MNNLRKLRKLRKAVTHLKYVVMWASLILVLLVLSPQQIQAGADEDPTFCRGFYKFDPDNNGEGTYHFPTGTCPGAPGGCTP